MAKFLYQDGIEFAFVRGRVKFFNKEKGFGFVVRDDRQQDVFIGSRSYKWELETKSVPEVGDVLYFEAIPGEKGRKEAHRWLTEATKEAHQDEFYKLVAWLKNEGEEDARNKLSIKIGEYARGLCDRIEQLNKKLLGRARILNMKLRSKIFPDIEKIRENIKKSVEAGEIKIGQNFSDEKLLLPEIDEAAAARVNELYPAELEVLGGRVKVSYWSTPPEIKLEGELAERWQELPDDYISLPSGDSVKVEVELPIRSFYFNPTWTCGDHPSNLKELKQKIYNSFSERVRKELKKVELPKLALTEETENLPEIIKRTGESLVDKTEVAVWATVVCKDNSPNLYCGDFKWEWFDEELEAQAALDHAQQAFKVFLAAEERRAQERARKKRIDEDLAEVQWREMFDNLQLPNVKQIRDGWAAVRVWAYTGLPNDKHYEMTYFNNAESAQAELDEARAELEKIRIHREGWPVYQEVEKILEKLYEISKRESEFKIVASKRSSKNRDRRLGAGDYVYTYTHPPVFKAIGELELVRRNFTESVDSRHFRVIASVEVMREWQIKAENG